MIRVYYLEVERVDNTDVVKGIEYIHSAILEVDGTLRKLTQDTTDAEHAGLIPMSESWREATQEEIALLEAVEPPPPPDPDAVRVAQLLSTSPSVITMPEIWELLRIYARRLGFIP